MTSASEGHAADHVDRAVSDISVGGNSATRGLRPVAEKLRKRYDDLHTAGAGIRPQCFERFTEFSDFLILNDDTLAAKAPGSFARTTFSGPEADFPSDHWPVSIVLDLGRL